MSTIGPICPDCGGQTSKVMDSRPAHLGIRRRRACGACNRRFTTFEVSEKDDGLDCPFCGGQRIRFDKHGFGAREHCSDIIWSTCCYDCGATFPNMYNKEKLVEKWKRRP